MMRVASQLRQWVNASRKYQTMGDESQVLFYLPLYLNSNVLLPVKGLGKTSLLCFLGPVWRAVLGEGWVNKVREPGTLEWWVSSWMPSSSCHLGKSPAKIFEAWSDQLGHGRWGMPTYHLMLYFGPKMFSSIMKPGEMIPPVGSWKMQLMLWDLISVFQAMKIWMWFFNEKSKGLASIFWRFD